MMADGGFSVEGQENIQEILSKQLYLCQFLVALGIVRTGGHFVCKVFDLFTPFSIGLVYLMYRSFDHVCIHKPVTSRPANSERYLICKGKKSNVRSVHNYFVEINRKLNGFGLSLLGRTSSDKDISDIVPMELIMSDRPFVEYVINSNNVLGERQVIGLAKIAAFCKNRNLYEMRQAEIKQQCLEFWKIPNEVRKALPYEQPQDKIQSLVQGSIDFMTSQGIALNPQNLSTSIRSKYDWKFVLLGSPSSSQNNERTFFLGLGRGQVYKMNPIRRINPWEKVDHNLKCELPPGTLIYAEIVTEFRGEWKSSRKIKVIHIIDAAFIGGEDLRDKDVKFRHELIKVMVKTVNKFTRNDLTVLRAKELFGLERMHEILNGLEFRPVKSFGPRPRLTISVDDYATCSYQQPAPRYFVPSGVIMFRVVKEPYMIALSKKAQKKYWFNSHKNTSVFECPVDACVKFEEAFSRRLIWSWEEGVQVRQDHEMNVDNNKLQGEDLVRHVMA